MIPLVTVDGLTGALVQIAGLALLSGAVALAAAAVYRWYAAQPIPDGTAVLVGVSSTALVLNTQGAIQSAIVGDTDLLAPASAGFTIAAFALAAVVADVGRRLGDRAGSRVAPVTALRDIGEMGQVVRSRGRAVTVTLPPAARIGDVDGYDPVSADRKAALAEERLVFPRGLTVGELRERLVERLRTDYGAGHVDVDLAPEGTVERLAVGSRPAGVGTTLVPGTVVVAVRADPPNAASSGDAVQVWAASTPDPDEDADTGTEAGDTGAASGGPEKSDDAGSGAGGAVEGPDDDPDGSDPRLVTTAEFRGASGDVATLALDAESAATLDDRSRYRLVTLPDDPAPDREFASLLRAADETMSVATVREGSALAGLPVGAIDATVVAVRGAGDAGLDVVPARDRTLAVGDALYVVARPETLRRVDALASGDWEERAGARRRRFRTGSDDRGG